MLTTFKGYMTSKYGEFWHSIPLELCNGSCDQLLHCWVQWANCLTKIYVFFRLLLGLWKTKLVFPILRRYILCKCNFVIIYHLCYVQWTIWHWNYSFSTSICSLKRIKGNKFLDCLYSHVVYDIRNIPFQRQLYHWTYQKSFLIRVHANI